MATKDEDKKKPRPSVSNGFRTEDKTPRGPGVAYGQGSRANERPSAASGFKTPGQAQAPRFVAPDFNVSTGFQGGLGGSAAASQMASKALTRSSGKVRKQGIGGALGAAAGVGMGRAFGQGGTSTAEAEKTLADYLSMAQELLGQFGGGGAPSISYEPERQQLRQNASENDARLEAMYRQLRGSIDADAPQIQQAYQGAIDSTAQTAQAAQGQMTDASNAANARNDQVLANLGIEQAQGQIIGQGRDLASQTAQQVADSAAQGQAANTRLASNQASALTHNTNIGNAAGLEGNLQRAQNNARLQSLLAELNMSEAQANQQAQASAAGNQFGQISGLAEALLGFDQQKQQRTDNLQMSAAELAAQERQAQLEAQGKSLPNLQSMLQQLAQLGIQIPENDPSSLARLLDVTRNYSIG